MGFEKLSRGKMAKTFRATRKKMKHENEEVFQRRLIQRKGKNAIMALKITINAGVQKSEKIGCQCQNMMSLR